MKKILYYVTIVSIALLAFACSEIDTPVLNQGSQPNATFTASLQKISVTDRDEGRFEIVLKRGNAAAEVDIPIKLTVDESVPDEIDFKLVTNTVKFAKGEYEITIPVECNTEEMEYYKEYRIVLEITDAAKGPLYPTGFANTRLDVKRDLVYNKIGTGHYTSSLFEEDWDQDILRADIPGVQRFRFPDLYYRNYHIEFYMNEDLTEITQFDIQPMGYTHSTYGMCYYFVTGSEFKGKDLLLTVRFYVMLAGGWGYLYDEKAIYTLPDEFFQQD